MTKSEKNSEKTDPEIKSKINGIEPEPGFADHDKAKRYFNCTDRERAAFEAGIKLASVYHQFVGAPICNANVGILEKAIEAGVRIQPFVKDVKITIDKKQMQNKNKRHEYDYISLTGNMLSMNLKINYNNTIANANIKYIKELDYPLMYVSSIE